MSARGKKIRSWIVFIAVVLVLGGGAAGVYHMRKVQASTTFPTVPARKGEFLVIIKSRGELRAKRSVMVYAPMVPQLRIAWLAPSGAMIHQGDLMIKFDSSAAEQQLQQKEAQLQQNQAALDQWMAQAKITAEQDKSDLADAEFNVEKAKLEVSKQEIVGALQAEESKIDLGLCEQKLRVAKATADLHAASDRSHIGSLTRQRDYAKLDVEITKQRIAQMEIHAPITGFLVFQTNYTQGWIDAKPFQVGDNAWAGMSLAELPDLSTLQMEGRVEEIDRGNIATGLEVRVHIDSLPELAIPAHIAEISPMAETSFDNSGTRSFKAWAPMKNPDSRLRPGMNGGMDIVINRIPNAISIPAKSLFTRDGKPAVYVADGAAYKAVEVKLLARNPDEVAISGIAPGTLVTTVDVEKKEKKR